MRNHLRVAFVAGCVCVAAVLLSVSPASAHTIVVVCDEETGGLVWSNVPPPDLEVTIVTSNGLTVVIPAAGSATSEYPGPGTWVATWTDGFVVEGEIPPACVDTTTTAAPTTTAPPTTAPPTTPPPTAPPTSEAGSNTVVPPTSAASSGRLPDTGVTSAAIAAGFLLAGVGVLVTVVARRRAAESA